MSYITARDVSVGAPPAAEHDLAARQYNTLIRPKCVVVPAAMAILEVLHHGDTLPSRDAMLAGQLVEPAGRLEIFVIVACSLKALVDALKLSVVSSAVLGTSARRSVFGHRVKMMLEESRPVEGRVLRKIDFHSL